MKTMDVVHLLRGLARDESGTASIEFAIVVGGFLTAIFFLGVTLGPAIHSYADRLSTISDHAQTVLNQLSAAQNNNPGP